MTKIYRPLTTTEFSVNNAITLYNQLNTSDDKYYLSIGRDTAWDASENDSLFRPPFPLDTQSFKGGVWAQTIGYVRIDENSVRLVEARKDWGDPDNVESKIYSLGDLTVTNTIEGVNTAIGQKDGYMVYRCAAVTESPQPVGTTFPEGTLSSIDTGDGYLWDYLYTIPQDEITKFVTPEWIVVPTPSQLTNSSPERWGREDLNVTVFDEGRIAYLVGSSNLMFYTLIEDTMFTEMIINGEAFRQISIISNPYSYELAPDVKDLNSDPLYFSETGEGGAAIDGWKIVASKADQATYLSTEILRETGEMIYIENRAPITRSFNQIEEIRIIVSF